MGCGGVGAGRLRRTYTALSSLSPRKLLSDVLELWTLLAVLENQKYPLKQLLVGSSLAFLHI